VRKITQEEFDNFPVIDGRKQCPSGDYSEIKVFGGRCRFGEGCSFGNFTKISCHKLIFNYPISISGLGDEKRTQK